MKAERFAIRLKKLVELNYLQVDFNIAFKTTKPIGSLFTFKENIKKVIKMSCGKYNRINRIKEDKKLRPYNVFNMNIKSK